MSDSTEEEEEDVIQDLKSRRLTRLGSAFPARPDYSCAIVAWDESRAIFTGGFRGGEILDSCFVYNKETMEFGTLPSMPHARYSCAAAIVGEKLFVIGGRGRDGLLDNIEVLDLSDPQEWRMFPVSLETPRSRCSAIAVNEHEIYIIGGGGMDGSATLDSVEILNTVTQTMTPGPSLLQSRSAFAAALVGDSIVVAGGSEYRASRIAINDCEQLSMRAGSDKGAHRWRPLNAMISERGSHHGVSFGNCMVVVGGVNRLAKSSKPPEVWNSTTGTWTQLPARLRVEGVVRGFVKLGDDLVCFVEYNNPSIHCRVYCLFSARGLLEHQRRQIRFNELIADERPEIVIPLLLEGLHQRGWTSLFYECIRETNGRVIPRREPTIEDDTMA